jgi:TPR repeat protein
MRHSLALVAGAVAFASACSQALDAPGASSMQVQAEPPGHCIVAERVLAAPLGPFERGLRAWTGEDGAGDAAKARTLLTEACDLGTGAACTVLGLMMEAGEGGPKESGQALLERGGHDSFDLGGCEEAAPPRSEGITMSVTACCRGARGCAAGCDAECKAAGAKIRAATIEVIERGCDRGEMLACHVAGMQFAYGVYVEPLGSILEGGARDHAVDLESRACQGGVARGCTAAGQALLPAPLDGSPSGDAARALLLLRRACDLGDGHGCFLLARATTAGPNAAPPSPASVAASRQLYERACALGMTAVCRDLQKP